MFQDFAQLFPVAHRARQRGLEMKGVGEAEREAIALEQLKLVKLEKFVAAYRTFCRAGCSRGSASRGRSRTIRRCC